LAFSDFNKMRFFSRSIIGHRGIVGAVFVSAAFLTYYFSHSTCAAGLVPCTNDCNLCYLIVGISNIVQWLMGSLLTITVLLGFTISGLTFIVSGAFPKVLVFAKSSIANTAKGAVLALFAWLIINGIMTIVGFKPPQGGAWWQHECAGGTAQVASNSNNNRSINNISNNSTACDAKNKKLESITIQCAGQKKTLPDNGSAFYVSLKTQKSMSQQLKAIGKYSCDGTTSEEDITQQAEWKASDETQIKVAKGLVQAVATSLGSSVPYVEANFQNKSSNQAKVYINACPNTKIGSAETKNKFSFSENSFAIPKANAQNMTDPILTDPVGQPIGTDDKPKRIEPLVDLRYDSLDPFGDCPACGGSSTSCAAVAANVSEMVGWKFSYPRNNNLRMDYGYGDCSSITSRAYTEAGCENPGESSDAICAHASPYSGDASSLKTGDIISFIGPKGSHTTICLNDGCNLTLGATAETGIVLTGVGADYWSGLAKNWGSSLKVTRCSDLCGMVNQDYGLE
jgi:hypothetical protein